MHAGGRRDRAREADGHGVRAARASSSTCSCWRRWQDPAQSDAVGQWARGAWKNVEPHTRGFYVNEFNDDAARMKRDLRRELRPHGGAQDEVRP